MNNATKPISLNDRIVVSARWIAISWSLRYARSWVKSLLRQTRLHVSIWMPSVFPREPDAPGGCPSTFSRAASSHHRESIYIIFFFFPMDISRARSVYGGVAFDPFRKPKIWRPLDSERTRNGDSSLHVCVWMCVYIYINTCINIPTYVYICI